MCVDASTARKIGAAKDDLQGLEGVNLNNLTAKGQRQLPMQGGLQMPALKGVKLFDPTKGYGNGA